MHMFYIDALCNYLLVQIVFLCLLTSYVGSVVRTSIIYGCVRHHHARILNHLLTVCFSVCVYYVCFMLHRRLCCAALGVSHRSSINQSQFALKSSGENILMHLGENQNAA